YAACEAVIGVWGIVLIYLMAPASASLLALIGANPPPLRQWSVGFIGTFLLLLPATAAMGATLPALERLLDGARPRGTGIASLYAANTFGAVIGVVAAAFWLIPEFGLLRTASLCAALNALCAVLACRSFIAEVRPVASTKASREVGILAVLALT